MIKQTVLLLQLHLPPIVADPGRRVSATHKKLHRDQTSRRTEDIILLSATPCVTAPFELLVPQIDFGVVVVLHTYWRLLDRLLRHRGAKESQFDSIRQGVQEGHSSVSPFVAFQSIAARFGLHHGLVGGLRFYSRMT